MGERKGQDRFTITFFNKYDLEEDEVRNIFGEIGRVMGFSYKNNRFFIRYGNKDEAQEALDKYRDKYQADFARERGERPPGGGDRSGGDGGRRFGGGGERSGGDGGGRFGGGGERSGGDGGGRFGGGGERSGGDGGGRFGGGGERSGGDGGGRFNGDGDRSGGDKGSRFGGGGERSGGDERGRFDRGGGGNRFGGDGGEKPSEDARGRRYDQSDARTDRSDTRTESGRANKMESNDDSKASLRDAEYNAEDPDSKALAPLKRVPDLIDATTKTSDKYLFVIGNLPPKFTQENVMDLITEVNPVHVGKIDTSPDLKLSFCPIHLDTMEKVEYLYKKLDMLVVAGHKLIAMEAADLIEEAGLGVA